MADYPTIYGERVDSIDPNDGSETRHADDGTARIRHLYGETQYTIRLTHPLVTHADYNAMLQFYQSYKAQVITWTDPNDGVVYDVLYAGPPRKTRTHNGMYCDVAVQFEATRQ